MKYRIVEKKFKFRDPMFFVQEKTLWWWEAFIGCYADLESAKNALKKLEDCDSPVTIIHSITKQGE